MRGLRDDVPHRAGCAVSTPTETSSCRRTTARRVTTMPTETRWGVVDAEGFLLCADGSEILTECAGEFFIVLRTAHGFEARWVTGEGEERTRHFVRRADAIRKARTEWGT